jgi:hypothetical protein
VLVLLKNDRILQSYRILRCTAAILDSTLGICGLLIPPWLIFNDFQVPLLFCNIVSLVGVTSIFAIVNITTLINIDRYFYILNPLKYLVYMSPRKTMIYVFLAVSIPFVTLLRNRVSYGVSIIPSEIFCGSDRTGVYLLIFMVTPCAFVSVFSIAKMRNYIKVASESNCQYAGGVSVKKHFKLVILVSGALWFTYIPSWLIRVVLNQFYHTDYINSPDGHTIFTILRLNSLLISYVSSSMNPCFLYFIEKDLFVGLQRILGRKVDFEWQRQIKEDIIN